MENIQQENGEINVKLDEIQEDHELLGGIDAQLDEVKQEHEEINTKLDAMSQQIDSLGTGHCDHPTGSMENPATSCNHILLEHPESPSGID